MKFPGSPWEAEATQWTMGGYEMTSGESRKAENSREEVFEHGKDARGRRTLSTKVTKMRKGLKRFGLGLVAVGLSVALLLTAAVPVCEARPDEMRRW